MFEKVIISAIRQYAPLIKEQGAPIIKQIIRQMLDEYKPKLNEDEESVDIVIQVQDGEVYFMMCSMSSDNRVMRCLDALTTEELIEKAELLGKKYKIL